MKVITILILFLSVTLHTLTAQTNPIEITGKIVESRGQAPIEYATVKLLDAQTGQMITGTTTTAEGILNLSTENPKFTLEISFIGFVPKVINEYNIINGKVDLGTLSLSEDAETLDEVVVRGEKSQTEFKLDKRVFNVGQDLSMTGASALEVLNNVPSVTVNIEGQIRLRGVAGVQILINGKPSVLASEQGNALGTLTADMIDRIEVITNPSAKYNAEGTSGIINIVLKKGEKRGLNGSVTLNTGIPNNHSLGFSLNNRTEKFNIFSQIGIGHRTFPQKFETLNRDLVNNSTIQSEGEDEKNETFFNIVLGTDFHINSQNILSLTGNFAYELETEFSNTRFDFLDKANPIASQWVRDEVTEATNPKWEYELQYQKKFSDDENHTLLFSALGSSFRKGQSSEFYNIPVFGTEALNEQQQTKTDLQQGEYTFKLDYSHPFTEEIIMETGAQYVITDVVNDFEINNWADNKWIENQELTNIFDYNQKVLGVYGTGAYEGEKAGVKLGLRMENTDLSTLLIESKQQNRQLFTNFFPSVHTSYKFANNFSLQGGYSRRISRPGMFALNPFFNIRNNFRIQTGNPDLEPEMTDSYEVTGIFDQELFSLSAAVYHRYITNVVENVSTFEENVSITKPMNIGTNRASGLEINVKYSPIEWWSLNGDFNFNYFHRQGNFESESFDFKSDQWTARLNSKFKLPGDIDIEIIGNYQSEFKTFQTITSGYVVADFGFRKKIMKGKTILNLSVRDVFESQIFERETLQPTFSLNDYRFRGRFITLGISYGFGKGEAMEFSGQKRF